jgi:hypothetical protein
MINANPIRTSMDFNMVRETPVSRMERRSTPPV